MTCLDIKTLARFDQPGHRVTETRTTSRSRSAGWDFVHVAVDDAIRLAYVEVLEDERKETTTGFSCMPCVGFATRAFASNGS